MANDLTLYDRLQWWDEDSPLSLLRHMNPGRFAYFGSKIPQWANIRVLDAGCGGGYASEYLAGLGAHVEGVDLSEAAIRAAADHATKGGVNGVNYRQGDITDLPYPDRTFDAVVCVDVLEHVPEWRKVLGEFLRVLRPGGQLFFDTINRNPLSAFVFVPLLERTFGLIAPGTHDPRLFIRPGEMHDGLIQAGFHKIHMTGFHVFWSPLRRSITSFAGGPRTLMYIGSAQKR